MPDTNTQTATPYERDAIFNECGPFSPGFMDEAVRTLMRSLPLDLSEPHAWSSRRMASALDGLAALHPRDEIEVMLGIQAIAAYHAAAACWRIGMNLREPHGDSTRHISAAATAARTFDQMLRALERRQAKPLSVPIGRPDPKVWPIPDPVSTMRKWEERARRGEDDRAPEYPDDAGVPVVWTEEDLAVADELEQRERIEKENEGLDIANTEGILPGGGMILMEEPTPQQAAYMGRRLGLMYKREYAENLRNGSKKIPKIRPIRPGDLIP